MHLCSPLSSLSNLNFFRFPLKLHNFYTNENPGRDIKAIGIKNG